MGFVLTGQELQAANTDVQLISEDTGASLQLTTLSKLQAKNGAPKKGFKNQKGKMDSFTVGDQETNGSIGMRLSEWRRIKKWSAEQVTDGRGIGQMRFTLSVSLGMNAAEDLRGTFKVPMLFQEDPFDMSNNQDALMVDLPLFVFGDIEHEGEQPFVNYNA